MPLATFSKPIALASPQLLCPAAARSAKLAFETPMRTRAMSTDRFMPICAYMKPPMKMPMR
jgi:hypothetical protein